MTAPVLEELPLIRAKGFTQQGTTSPAVGPGSYELARVKTVNESHAPFNSTSARRQRTGGKAMLPGPGYYETNLPWDKHPDKMGSVPFISESSRFAPLRGSDAPGPGTYSSRDSRAVKKVSRVYTFPATCGTAASADGAAPLGPGRYNPNLSAADRRNPKATEFGKSSGREPMMPAAGPGPANYDPQHHPRYVSSAKPSSMFVTKTKRTVPGDEGGADTPGPGTYNIVATSARYLSGQREPYSTFGTTVPRFPDDRAADLVPGPGTYLGEIAPRRFRPATSLGTLAFLSASDRFSNTWSASAPGPGTYDYRHAHRHEDFAEPSSFSSTVCKFGPMYNQHPESEPLDFSGVLVEKRPARSRTTRPFVQRKLTPSTVAPPFKERNYDVRDNWPKTTSMAETSFGLSARVTLFQRPAADAPGPATYNYDGGAVAAGQRSGRSTWGRDPRFVQAAPPQDDPEPRQYPYGDSTLLTKSHNVTIGSDATWI